MKITIQSVLFFIADIIAVCLFIKEPITTETEAIIVANKTQIKIKLSDIKESVKGATGN